MTAAPAPAPTRSLNLIDAIIGAGRLYGAYAWTVIGFSLGLQAIKVVAMFLAHLAFGKLGYEIGAQIATLLLIINGGVCARLAFDVQAGVPPSGPGELLQRSRPFLSSLVLLAAFYILALGAVYLVFGTGVWLSGVHLSYDVYILPVFVVVAVWALAAAALVADNLTPNEALRMAWKLIRPALAVTVLFVVFQWFVLRLIPALADSIIGRHAPLEQWWIVEGLVSAIISPLLALTTATFFLALYERTGPEALEEVRPPVVYQLPPPPGPMFALQGPATPIPVYPFQGPPAPGQPFAPQGPPPPGMHAFAAPGSPAAGEPMFVTQRPPTQGGPVFVQDGPAERLRHMPVGFDRVTIRRLQWQYGAFWFVPSLLLLVALMGAPVSEDDKLGDALSWFALALALLAQAFLAERVLLPYVRELQARGARGVRVQAVVRAVNYRPWWAIIGVRMQMLRYFLPDGTVLESCSQSRDRKLQSGQVKIARYDPAEPLWVILEDAPIPRLLRRLNLASIWMSAGAVGAVVLGLIALT